MKKIKKSQISMEFISFVAFGIILLLIILPFTFRKTIDYDDDKELIELNDIVYAVQNEFNLALNVEDGYTREFVVPGYVNEEKINLIHNNTNLKLYTEKYSRSVRIPTVNGDIVIGKNIINKNNGVINVN